MHGSTLTRFTIHLPIGGVAAVACFLVTAIMSLTPSTSLAAQFWEAPATEYVQLPKFCWSQFNGGPKGPEYSILNCGVGMNHYCIGLLELLRLKGAKNAGERNSHLQKAREHTLYTMEWMKREGTTATCPIASHVEGTMRDIEIKRKIYGIK